MDIMSMATGTKIRNTKSGLIYILGDYVNDVARELCNESFFSIDYINKNTQCDYELV